MKWQNFMVGTDFSEQSTICLRLANIFAQKLNGKLDIVHVSNNFEENALPIMMDTVIAEGKTYQQIIKENLETILDVQLNKAAVTKSGQVSTSISLGNPKNELVRLIQEKKTDLLFLGFHGHNILSELVMGSVTEKMLKVSPCSLFIIKEKTDKLPTKVNCFVDFSEYTDKVVDTLVELNNKSPIQVSFCHLVEADPELYLSVGEGDNLADVSTIQQLLDREESVAKQNMEKLIGKAKAKGLNATGDVAVGKDFQTAPNLLAMPKSQQADLLVIAPHSKSFIEKFLFGSTALKIIEQSKKNLLIVK